MVSKKNRLIQKRILRPKINIFIITAFFSCHVSFARALDTPRFGDGIAGVDAGVKALLDLGEAETFGARRAGGGCLANRNIPAGGGEGGDFF